jgi:diketogulonate reductase-like aldo/keto reductase
MTPFPSLLSICLLLVLLCSSQALVPDQAGLVSRRAALIGVTTTATVATGFGSLAKADDTTVDMAAINAARANKAAKAPEENNVDMNKINAARSNSSSPRAAVPIYDPPPLLSIRGGPEGKSNIKIPRIGYSFYKTAADQAARCTATALRSGVRHLDVATLYMSNAEISKPLKKYLDIGLEGLDFSAEKPDVLEQLDATRLAGERHATSTIGGGTSTSNLAPPPKGSLGRRGRRDGLFISHKISNEEQSTDPVSVRRAVKAAIATLGCSYLDMVSIHSPLTDKARRLASYQTLLDLRDSGFVRSVGVCNYGLGPLQEIAAANLELPAVNQLELSPFNLHGEVVEWCAKNGVSVACGAWSKLSGADGPAEGWTVVAELAQKKGMTKAQVLARWSMQSGYICVPRSASASKIERLAIAENSYGGVNVKDSFMLSNEEMSALQNLDISYKAGKLGRRDGWGDSYVSGVDWDPTDFA